MSSGQSGSARLSAPTLFSDRARLQRTGSAPSKLPGSIGSSRDPQGVVQDVASSSDLHRRCRSRPLSHRRDQERSGEQMQVRDSAHRSSPRWRRGRGSESPSAVSAMGLDAVLGGGASPWPGRCHRWTGALPSGPGRHRKQAEPAGSMAPRFVRYVVFPPDRGHPVGIPVAVLLQPNGR